MIIQCDQCNTKFKLEDVRVPDKGIKVRCAKCKHVFMVQRETSAEEPDFDFLLSGLGAPASDAEKGLSLAGETVSPPTGEKEGQLFAQAPDTAVERESGLPAAGSAEQTQDGEFGEDFFAVKEEAAAPEEKALEPGEFSFENEETQASYDAGATLETPPEKTGEFEFGEFPFEEESTAESVAVVAPTSVLPETEGFDFESADFAAEEHAEIKSGMDFGDVNAGESKEEGFSFGEEESVPETEDQSLEEKPGPSAKAEEAFDFSEFAAQPVVGSEAENQPFAAQEEKKEAEAVPPDLGDIDFGDKSATGPAVMKVEEIKPDKEVSPAPVAEAVSPPSFVSLMPSAEEELPPLAISTRKKGGSFFPRAVTTIVLLLVMAIAGVGLYVFMGGPAAFNKLGLSFVAKWVGMEVAEEGVIAIKNPQGAFMVNREAGEIFVVTGEAVNNFKKPRASIQVKANVLGPKGEILMQKAAYCGNVLSKEQLATLPMAKIEEAMGSPFGDSLANLGVQPGKSIPFVIVFNVVQKNAAEFSTEVVGSTAVSQ
jgi:predicted Zn finger-like uncharacterized protein